MDIFSESCVDSLLSTISRKQTVFCESEVEWSWKARFREPCGLWCSLLFALRFVCEGTVEEKILQLQEKKKDLAKQVLSGSEGPVTKLTLADLKILFGI